MDKLKNLFNNYKSIPEILAVMFVVAFVIVAVYVLSGLTLWGIGLYVIKVFEIDYTWTFSHGLATSLVLAILSNVFKSRVTVNK